MINSLYRFRGASFSCFNLAIERFMEHFNFKLREKFFMAKEEVRKACPQNLFGRDEERRKLSLWQKRLERSMA